MNTKKYNLILSFYVLDIIMLCIAFVISLVLKYEYTPPQHTLYGFIIMLITWIGLLFARVTDPSLLFLRKRVHKAYGAMISTFAVYIGLVSTALFAFKLGNYSRLQVYGTIAIFFALKSLVFFFCYWWIKSRRLHGRNLTKVLVVGAGRLSHMYYNTTEAHPEMGFKVYGFLENEEERRPKAIRKRIVGKVEDISSVLKQHSVDLVVIAYPNTQGAALDAVISAADYYGKRIAMIPDFNHQHDRHFESTSLAEMTMFNINVIPLDQFRNMVVKRLFDVFLALIAVLVFFIPMLIIAFIIKLDSKGPVLYRPIRVTRGGEEFEMYKFRTMYVKHPADAPQGSTIKNDPRITRVGKYLRKLNLDELPQLWNVLNNTMSLIGPRPHRVALNEDLQKSVGKYMVRHYVKPGLTGWAQVNGWRGPTETKEQREQRTKHDLWYIRHWSFGLDLKIIWLTAFGKKTYKSAF